MGCTYLLYLLQKSGKESNYKAGNAGNLGSVPDLARSPGGGHDNPLQQSCPDSSMDRGAWKPKVHEVAESDMRLKQLRSSSSSITKLVPSITEKIKKEHLFSSK